MVKKIIFYFIILAIIASLFIFLPKPRELKPTEAIIWKGKWKISIDGDKFVFSYWEDSNWVVHSELEPPG